MPIVSSDYIKVPDYQFTSYLQVSKFRAVLHLYSGWSKEMELPFLPYRELRIRPTGDETYCINDVIWNEYGEYFDVFLSEYINDKDQLIKNGWSKDDNSSTLKSTF